MKHNKKNHIEELKKFALVMTIAFATFGGIYIWKNKTNVGMALQGVSAIFAILALVKPQALGPIESIWMRFAELISAVMTRVIMTFAFFVLITPMGLFMRLFGKSPLELKFDKNKKSYWEPVEPDGPGSRPYLPY